MQGQQACLLSGGLSYSANIPFEEIICFEEETVRSTFLIQGLLGKDMKAARSFLAFDYVHVKALGNELASKIQ